MAMPANNAAVLTTSFFLMEWSSSLQFTPVQTHADLFRRERVRWWTVPATRSVSCGAPSLDPIYFAWNQTAKHHRKLHTAGMRIFYDQCRNFFTINVAIPRREIAKLTIAGAPLAVPSVSEQRFHCLSNQSCLAPTVSAIVAPRVPMGFGLPVVVSRTV
jgi:hypothetical protein